MLEDVSVNLAFTWWADQLSEDVKSEVAKELGYNTLYDIKGEDVLMLYNNYGK